MPSRRRMVLIQTKILCLYNQIQYVSWLLKMQTKLDEVTIFSNTNAKFRRYERVRQQSINRNRRSRFVPLENRLMNYVNKCACVCENYWNCNGSVETKFYVKIIRSDFIWMPRVQQIPFMTHNSVCRMRVLSGSLCFFLHLHESQFSLQSTVWQCAPSNIVRANGKPILCRLYIGLTKCAITFFVRDCFCWFCIYYYYWIIYQR